MGGQSVRRGRAYGQRGRGINKRVRHVERTEDANVRCAVASVLHLPPGTYREVGSLATQELRSLALAHYPLRHDVQPTQHPRATMSVVEVTPCSTSRSSVTISTTLCGRTRPAFATQHHPVLPRQDFASAGSTPDFSKHFSDPKSGA